MAYFTWMAKCEEVQEQEFERTRDGQTELARKVQFSLAVPGMRDRVVCELPAEDPATPKPSELDRWEMEEVWVVASGDSMRAIGFERKNARPGEKASGALVIFQLTEIREANPDERKKLLDARKVQKLKVKDLRAKRAEAKKRERDAEKAAQLAAQGAQVKQSA